uniref:Progestin and adipoQ receptor family member 9 n=1 Tax=Sinocyclocheilus grahami TaxID=75366 RepID=A0A672T5W1_SINGR
RNISFLEKAQHLNLSFGPVMWSLPLLRYTDVPPRVTENFILSGYRFPNYSLRQCLVSAFRPTNETGNFWTHFLPIFVFTFHFLEVFTWEGAPEPSNPFFYPFWNYFLGVLYLLLGSSLAHLLNSMSLIIREICFFVDYGTISAYTVGSSLAYYYYIHPQVQLFFDSLYIPSSCLIAIICVITCCNTRQCWRKYRYAVRTLVFLLPFFISSAPVFYRLLSPSASSPSSSSPHLFSTMATFFYRHCFWLVVSAFFNISKIPERFSPGNFDIWGHSHQWFHCCTFLKLTLPRLVPRGCIVEQTFQKVLISFTREGCMTHDSICHCLAFSLIRPLTFPPSF